MTASSPAADILAGARTYVEKGEHLRAAAAFSKAAKLDATDPAIPIELCMALIQLNKYPKALAAADQALSMDPVSSKAHLWRGVALQGLKRFEDACLALQEAVGLEEGGGSKSVAAQALEQCKWQCRQAHDQAGTDVPAVAAGAEAPGSSEPSEQLTARDHLVFKLAQAKKSRQSKAGRAAMADKGTGVTEVIGNLSRQAEDRAAEVLGRLDINEGAAAGGGGDAGKLRYSSERCNNFAAAEMAKLRAALNDPTDLESYRVPVAIMLPAAGSGPEDVEGQGISLSGSFSGMDKHVMMLPFLRDMGRKLAAHAMVLIVPRGQMQYPQPWAGPDAVERWPAGCPADATGWFVQLETKVDTEVDSKMWFIAAEAEGVPAAGGDVFAGLGTIAGAPAAAAGGPGAFAVHGLDRGVFSLTRGYEMFDVMKARTVQRRTAKSGNNKKGKKNRR